MVTGGRQGDDVTTTGGPEHSLAEPAINARMDGDDIVVIPDAPPVRHRRSRAFLVGVVVIVLVAAGIGIAVAATRDDSKQRVQSTAPARPIPRTPSQPPRDVVKQPPVREPPKAGAKPRT